MLHHRLLTGFLNTSLGNTIKKTFKRHLPNHNCMIPYIKTYFNKNGNISSFGASVVVKHSSSLLNICTFKMKSNLKTSLIFKNVTKTCAIANLYSNKHYRGKKTKKTCQGRPCLSTNKICICKQNLWNTPMKEFFFSVNHIPAGL